MSIAILIPMCSRNETWEQLSDCYFSRCFEPSFERTKSSAYKYQIYAGIDDDDAFFLKHESELKSKGIKVLRVSGCQHAPAQVWNHLFEVALKDGHEYFFQIGDDVIIQSRKWTERFIEVLQSHNNKGVVGPCHPFNFWMRKKSGQDVVIENAFVHKTHYDIFGSFFPKEIKNWYCDNWITQVYKPFCSYTCEDIIVQNQCIDKRYNILHHDITELVKQGRDKLISNLKGCFAFCLFGTADKYRKGMLKNIEMIQELYPTWDIHLYVGNDCDQFDWGVSTHHTHREGFVNVFYRFYSLFDSEYDVVCVRDADSRIHSRDQWCIDHFLHSDFTAYTIRDHPYHMYPVMGGLFGIKRNHPLFSRKELDDEVSKPAKYASDTSFLERVFDQTNMIVYSYDPSGLLPSQNVQLIETPITNQNFCGNVMLFKEDGSEYPEFTHPENK